MPRGRVKTRTPINHRNWTAQQPSPTPPTAAMAANVPPQDEVGPLLQERLDLHAQLFEAAQIHRKLSGPRVLQLGDMQFASEVFAARYLPGDFTVLSQNGSKVLTTLGDIAGKGFAAGMWFTHLAALLQNYGHPDYNLGSTASEINRHLCYLRPVAPFVTVFMAQVDCDLGALTYCNAGHFPPVLLRADGRTEMLTSGGPLLGAIEDAEFESGQVLFEPGDTLVVYSDGVLECRGASGEEFGSDRLLTTVREAKQPTAQATLMMLLAAVQDFANGNPLSDDVSLAVIQRDSQW
jgi:serine phosphatase RsbU (regulator of sigma subunit)